MPRSVAPRSLMARSAEHTAAPFVHTCLWPAVVCVCHLFPSLLCSYPPSLPSLYVPGLLCSHLSTLSPLLLF